MTSLQIFTLDYFLYASPVIVQKEMQFVGQFLFNYARDFNYSIIEFEGKC